MRFATLQHVIALAVALAFVTMIGVLALGILLSRIDHLRTDLSRCTCQPAHD